MDDGAGAKGAGRLSPGLSRLLGGRARFPRRPGGVTAGAPELARVELYELEPRPKARKPAWNGHFYAAHPRVRRGAPIFFNDFNDPAAVTWWPSNR